MRHPAQRPNHNLRVNRSEEHTSELQSLRHLVCRLLLEKKKTRRLRTRAHTRRPGPRTSISVAGGWPRPLRRGSCGVGIYFIPRSCFSSLCFFFNNTATPELYPFSLHAAFPI